MIESIVNDNEKVLPCSVYLDGEYGYEDIFLGVPVMLGPEGVKEIVVLELNDEEQELLDRSAESVREVVSKMR